MRLVKDVTLVAGMHNDLGFASYIYIMTDNLDVKPTRAYASIEFSPKSGDEKGHIANLLTRNAHAE